MLFPKYVLCFLSMLNAPYLSNPFFHLYRDDDLLLQVYRKCVAQNNCLVEEDNFSIICGTF